METGLHSEGTPRPEQQGVAGAQGGPRTPRGLLGTEQEGTRLDPNSCFPLLLGR